MRKKGSHRVPGWEANSSPYDSRNPKRIKRCCKEQLPWAQLCSGGPGWDLCSGGPGWACNRQLLPKGITLPTTAWAGFRSRMRRRIQNGVFTAPHSIHWPRWADKSSSYPSQFFRAGKETLCCPAMSESLAFSFFSCLRLFELAFVWGRWALPRCKLCQRVCVCVCRQAGWQAWWDPFYLFITNIAKSWALMPRQLSFFKSAINLFLSESGVIENYLELVAKLVCYKIVINVSETPGKVYYWQGENESPDTNISLR